MLDTGNQLKGDYNKNFLTHRVNGLAQQIPKERRGELAGEIRMRAALFGCKDEKALKATLKSLEGGQESVSSSSIRTGNYQPSRRDGV